MLEHTDEFSFILKRAKYGIGVFATHGIKKDTPLRLFGDKEKYPNRIRARDFKLIPEDFRKYCVLLSQEKVDAPIDFGAMEIGWYMNHSEKANAYRKDFNWYAGRDLKAGEEILINYNDLNEPEELKEEYFKN